MKVYVRITCSELARPPHVLCCPSQADLLSPQYALHMPASDPLLIPLLPSGMFFHCSYILQLCSCLGAQLRLDFLQEAFLHDPFSPEGGFLSPGVPQPSEPAPSTLGITLCGHPVSQLHGQLLKEGLALRVPDKLHTRLLTWQVPDK